MTVRIDPNWHHNNLLHILHRDIVDASSGTRRYLVGCGIAGTARVHFGRTIDRLRQKLARDDNRVDRGCVGDNRIRSMRQRRQNDTYGREHDDSFLLMGKHGSRLQQASREEPKAMIQ